jgi:hypothetical protein
LESVEVGVISRPRRILFGAAGRGEIPNDVTVWIEYANVRHVTVRKVFLSSCFSEQ